jgi:hypothetical protein
VVSLVVLAYQEEGVEHVFGFASREAVHMEHRGVEVGAEE